MQQLLQTIELLKELRGVTNLSVDFKDLGLVRRIADRVLVMLRGRIIEEIDIEDLAKLSIIHTQKLLGAAQLGQQTPDSMNKAQLFT